MAVVLANPAALSLEEAFLRWPVSAALWEEVLAAKRRSVVDLMEMRAECFKASQAAQKAYWNVFRQGWPGLLSWMNLCVWVYEPRNAENRRRIPMITWDVQDEVAPKIWRAVKEQYELCTDKSRDMSASWLCLLAFDWFWHFEDDSLFTMASRVEDDVDRPGDPDSLFWKLDYSHRHEPSWLQPRGWERRRRHLHIENPENGSVIDGESSSAHVGRGGRRKAILLDEFAAAANALAILSSTRDNTNCRIFNSTPQGAGHFDDQKVLHGNAFAAVRHSGLCEVITLHWSRHPTKGAGLYKGTPGKAGEPGKLDILDKGYLYPRGYRFIMDGKVRSPWYDKECATRGSMQEIAQNLDIDYLASGSMFFDSPVFARIRASGSLRPPDHRGDVRFEALTEQGAITGVRPQSLRWLPNARTGRLNLWCPLETDTGGVMVRPPQHTNYVAFCDIGLGNGASNSVMDIGDVMRREQVGQFVSSRMPPQEFATACVAIVQWLGGANGWPFLGWESNGPGEEFGPQVIRLGYPYVYRKRQERQRSRPRTKDIGWRSTRADKRKLLGELRGALGRDEITVHCDSSIIECEQYINYAGGGCGPSGLTEEPEGARATHGDRTIALAGMNLMLLEQGRVKMPAIVPPAGSFAARREAYMRKEREKKFYF